LVSESSTIAEHGREPGDVTRASRRVMLHEEFSRTPANLHANSTKAAA
jgi:hypothetical protein